MAKRKTLPLKFFFLFVFLSSAACSACGKNSNSTTEENTTVTVKTSSGSYPFSVEVADAAAERATGLMNRTKLADDAGMIFTWDEDTESSFWMKDTYISLDMLFINVDKSVVYIKTDATPLSEDLITPTSSYRYVLEVKNGFVGRSGVVVGDQVELNL